MRYGIIIALVLLFAGNAIAQRGAIEIAASAGPSINSNPSGNMVYKGDKISMNYTAAIQGLYNVHRSISVGLEFRVTELSRKSSLSDSAHLVSFNSYIGGDNKRYIYAKKLMATSVVGNARLNLSRAYLYGGVALGYGFTAYNASKRRPNESYRAPDGGSGFCFGFQAGYTYGLTHAIALNIEGSLRNYSLRYTVVAPGTWPSTDLHYNITAYAISIGLKIAIMPKYKQQNYIPAFRGKGRSAQPRRP